MASRKQQFWSDYIDGIAEERRPTKAAPRTTAPKTAIAKLAYAMGELVRDSDLQDDEEDEGSPSPKAVSFAKKNLKGGQESLKFTSKTISQAQKIRSQAKDVAAATAWTAKFIRR